MASALFDTLNARGMSQRLAQILASAIAGGGLPLVYGAAGTVLVSTGSAAQWGPVDLSDADARTGQLPAANIVTGTSGANIPLLNGANTWGALQTFTSGLSFGGTTLSNYTEGTFTPTFAFSTPGDSVITPSTAAGVYTRIGRTVNVFVVMTFATNAYTTAAGNATISGLPFAPGFALPLAQGYTDRIVIPANTLQLAPMVTTSSTILLWAVKDNATASTPLTTAAFPASTSGFSFYISGTYYV